MLLSLHAMPAWAQKVDKSDYYFVLDTGRGLSDNCVLQMMQLPDGRLAVVTARGVDLYDGKRFAFVPLPTASGQTIDAYRGQTHLYVDGRNRLWVKSHRRIHCIDLAKDRLVDSPLDSLAAHCPADSIGDLFVDGRGRVWVVSGLSAINTADGERLTLDAAWGDLQDLDTDGRCVYTFHANGLVAVFRNGRLFYTASAYSQAEAKNYRRTSLTVQTRSGQFYQIRTGRGRRGRGGGSVFLRFDPATRAYTKIYECDYVLHTLNMTSGNQALISSQRGYLMFDFNVGGAPREVSELSLPDGRSLTTGINTVLRDNEGAIWLGTYRDGLIYVSPMLGLFFTIDKPWWQSAWGVAAIVAMVAIVGALGFGAYRRNRRLHTVETSAVAEVSAAVAGASAVAKTSAIAGEDGKREVTAEAVDAEPQLVANARTLVEQHLRDCDYGVEQLANDLCMERTGLYKKFTSQLGTTPVAFIRSVRLGCAASLLREGRLSVNEIAERTGFSSPSYFTRCFKKEYGVLPSEYK